MGADFVYGLFPVVSGRDSADRVMASVDKVPETELAQWAEQYGLDGDTPDDCRQALRDSIDAVLGIGDWREVAMLQLDSSDVTYWISGGVTWGDVPTEAYGIIERAAACQTIWDAATAEAKAAQVH